MTEGLEPSTDAETFIEFDSRIAQKGIVPAMYRELRKKVGDLGPKETTAESARDKMVFAKGFVDACRAATEQMGKDLKLAPAGKEDGGYDQGGPDGQAGCIQPLLRQPARRFMICAGWPAR